mmetsp:Transcript_68881/g.193230  ORF Transcript_68881/g.193230 Transcript_68881/m.193230 type:complete len:754 (+) Transcript_68881:101-2362(+)
MASQYSKLDHNDGKTAPLGGTELYQEQQRRRSYEMCMVFKCKTSKNVKFDDGDQVVTDVGRSEPTEGARKTMLMWKSRREAYLKSLANCGLRLFCYYSRDRDEVLVKIGASPQKLRDVAARLKYKLQLKAQYLNAYAEFRHDFPGRPERGHRDRRMISHIYKTHTEDDYPDSDAIFKTTDKINLIHHMITSKDKDCAGINIGDLLLRGDLKAYFPLHESHLIAEMKSSWLPWLFMPEDFANKFHDYFGGRVAFYFLFMSYYWKWLFPIAAVGIVLQLIDLLAATPDNITAIPFCILMSVWATFLPYFWRRQEAKHAVGWGSLDFTDQFEKCRPEHYGDSRINPVTSQKEPHYSFRQRLKHYALSASVMTLTSVVTVVVLLALLVFRHRMNVREGGLWTFQLGMAGFIEIVNWCLTQLAIKLTQWENHRTQTEHETHMLSKVLVLKFICTYCVLYYTAFFKHHQYLFGVTPMECWKDDCILDLQWQLGIFVTFRLTISNIVEYLSPKVSLWWRSQSGWFNCLVPYSTSLELADMSAAEQQAKKNQYNEFDTFDDALLSHGFTSFFAVASPWVCAASLVGCWIETVLDMKSLLDNRQRPIPYRARSNEPWSTAYDLYGVLAASTNIFLLIFASKEYDSWNYTEKLVLFIYLEHMILIARLVLRLIFPQVPGNVELLQLKQEHMVHRCLENIKVEQNQDFSMFRDHRSSNIQVFDQDIMDREDGDDREPEFDLTASMHVLREGLEEEAGRILGRKH